MKKINKHSFSLNFKKLSILFAFGILSLLAVYFYNLSSKKNTKSVPDTGILLADLRSSTSDYQNYLLFESFGIQLPKDWKISEDESNSTVVFTKSSYVLIFKYHKLDRFSDWNDGLGTCFFPDDKNYGNRNVYNEVNGWFEIPNYKEIVSSNDIFRKGIPINSDPLVPSVVKPFMTKGRETVEIICSKSTLDLNSSSFSWVSGYSGLSVSISLVRPTNFQNQEDVELNNILRSIE